MTRLESLSPFLLLAFAGCGEEPRINSRNFVSAPAAKAIAAENHGADEVTQD